MARRCSNGAGSIDEISQSLTVCNSQLEQLAKVVQNDCKDFPAEKLVEWKQKILFLVKKTAVVNNISIAAKNVRVEERQRPRPENTENSESIDVVTRKMMKIVAERTTNFDGSNTPLLKKVAGVLKIGIDEEEEDIVLMDEEYQESSFRCPFTTQMMVDPMTNGQCIHRISKVALSSILKKGRCMMPGCKAIWNGKNAKADPAFQAEMDRFYRNKATQAASSSSSSEARGRMGDDDGYSEL